MFKEISLSIYKHALYTWTSVFSYTTTKQELALALGPQWLYINCCFHSYEHFCEGRCSWQDIMQKEKAGHFCLF